MGSAQNALLLADTAFAHAQKPRLGQLLGPHHSCLDQEEEAARKLCKELGLSIAEGRMLRSALDLALSVLRLQPGCEEEGKVAQGG